MTDGPVMVPQCAFATLFLPVYNDSGRTVKKGLDLRTA